MARNEHDIVRDHFGVLEEDQLASGTPTAGTAPIATGTGTAAWGAAASPLIIQDEGTPLTTAASTLNFVGSGVAATGSGSTKTITVAGADEKAKVSSNDTTAGYLNGKLVAGTNITMTENNDGGNETLEIIASSTPINWLGTWSAGTYNANDGVVHDGSSYVALTTTTDEPPSADWQLVAEVGSTTITVEESGDTPISGVDHIVFDGATVVDDTGGQVTVTVTGGSGLIGKQLIAAPPGLTLATTGQAPTASAAFVYPVVIEAEMELRAFAVHMTSNGSGTTQWGLFDYSSSVTSCTKLAGGSGSLNGTGERTIAASGAPVTIAPGAYVVIFLLPASNQGSWARSSGQPALGGKVQTSYAWDDTPNLTTGWSATTITFNWWLKGDLDGSGNQW